MGNKNKLPDVFQVEQLIKIFDVVEDPKVAVAIALAFYCGLRISEVCKLKIEDIDLENKKLKVVDSKFSMRTKTKYGKDRYVLIPDMMISPIQKWIGVIQGGKWAFPSDKSPNTHIRPKTLGEKFREILIKSGLAIPMYNLRFKQKIYGKKVDKKVTRYKYHFHTLRHSYATYLLGKGVDIYTISDLLGHNQVTTTQIYAKISDVKRRDAIDIAFNQPRTMNNSQNQGFYQPQPQTNELDKLQLEIKAKELEIKKMELMREIEKMKAIGNTEKQHGNLLQSQMLSTDQAYN